MKASVPAWIAAGVLAVGVALAQDRTLHPQYGLAHRVNTATYIDEVLDADLGGGSVAGTGMEFDVSYSGVHGDWFVSHGEAIISPDIDPTLREWLQTLHGHLTGSAKFDRSFAVLFVDVKTPNEDSVATVMDLVRQYVPSDVAVIYALNDVDNFDTETKGYDILKAKGLLPNEGVQGWMKDVADVDRFYQVMKRDRIERNTVEQGHAFDISETVLTEINQPKYHSISDPYRFKKVFTWTLGLQSSMEDYLDPDHSYRTDGQLVGSGTSEYLPHYDDLDDFTGAVATFSATRRVADRTDLGSFWERGVSDQVMGDLIYVNNAGAGAVRTGAKHSPFATMPAGLAATVNGARIVVTPGRTYPGVSRIAKPLRLEKSPGAGVVRITN